jgi:hypothetical protein
MKNQCNKGIEEVANRDQETLHLTPEKIQTLYKTCEEDKMCIINKLGTLTLAH